MAPKLIVMALSMFAIAAPVTAANQDADQPAGAPAAGENAKYCMWVEPATGSRIETIECWTRAEWAEQEVDIDKEWAKEGVSVIA
jgi:hypothetical protein